MKPLATNRLMLTWLCFQPADASVSIKQKLAYIAVISIAFGVKVAYFFEYWVYFLEFVSVDLEESLYAIYEISGNSGVVFMTVIVLFQRYKMSSLLKGLGRIYDERKKFLLRSQTIFSI